MLFPTYDLEDPGTGRVRQLGAADYLLAGVLASLYVLWQTDMRTFTRALVTNVVFIILAGVGVLTASSLPGIYALFSAIGIPILLAAMQSREMIKYVVVYHAINGWDVTRE